MLGKQGPWTQYPERMLKLRARGFTLRDAFPDVLKGIKAREEVEDYLEGEYKVVEGSRTEFLKKDLLTKKDANDEINTKTSNLATQIQHKEDLSQTEFGSDSSRVVTPGTAEDEASGEDCITQKQMTDISALLEDKGFDEIRIAKALEYYEVDKLEQLSYESAVHFITQLNKL